MHFAIYLRAVDSARGAERVSANVARGLADLGHRIDFLVEDDAGHLVAGLREHANIEVVSLKTSGFGRLADRWYQLKALLAGVRQRAAPLVPVERSWLKQLLRFFRKNDPPVYAICRYIDSSRPDSVLSFLNHPNLTLMLVALLRPGRARYLVNVRNHISTSVRSKPSKWMRSVQNLMRRQFVLADLVLAPSEGVGEDVRLITGLPPERIVVVHNPVFRPEILALAGQPVTHEWFGDPAVPVIVAAGKLKPQKDFVTLLKAFARVRNQRVARLVILGEGAQREALEQLADELEVAGDVDLPGFVVNPYPYFRNAALFVLSSAWEGLPNVLIEAMACGCPVVATDCPSGPDEILDGGKVGRLVPVADVEAMAAAIDELLDEKDARERYVERAKVYSYEQSVAGYERALGARNLQ
jgi:glycosyltransferase involved in cell wall biosynthesis